MRTTKLNRRDFVKSAAAVALAGIPPAMRAAPGEPAARGVGRTLAPRPLGRTGAEVSALALGGVIAMQQPASANLDPAAVAERALDLGITYFDTAPAYSNGQSESNYGRVLARRRREVFLATKTGDRTYDGTMRSVERSLERLRTDHVDLLQIHGVGTNEDLDAWEKPDGVLAALAKLREQKVTRFIGITGHDSAERMRQATDRWEFDTVLCTLNPVARRRPFREELLSAANRKRMGVIAMKVMGGGNGCLVKGNPFQKVLRPYHDDCSHQVDSTSLIRYVLGLPISVAVIGVASLEQLEANITVVRETTPMLLTERERLETFMA